MKTVEVFKTGQLIKTFLCDRAEIADKELIFHGVPTKEIPAAKCNVVYRAPVYYEVDYEARRAYVNLLNEDAVELFIHW